MQTQNVTDVVHDCAYVLTFLSDALGTFPSPRETLSLSYASQIGFSLILDDVSKRLVASADALSDKRVAVEVQS